MGTRTTARPASAGKTGQPTDKPPSAAPPTPPRSVAPSGDYLIPRQEAAYAIGLQRGIEIGRKMAQEERGETREITATATTVVSTQIAPRPISLFSIDGPHTLEASDRGLSWVMLTLNALTCVMMAYLVIKMILRGF